MHFLCVLLKIMANEYKHNTPIEELTRYLAGEASHAEQVEVETWRDASPENLREFSAIKKLWERSEDVKHHETIDLDVEWERIEQKITPHAGRIISLNRVLQIAASIVVLMGLAYLLMQQTQTITTKTQVAQVQIIDLPDGSRVTLNAASKLSYSKTFGTSDRMLSLKGEAFFEVTKNKSLPFIIDAQGASIKVVGTRFNVKAYKNTDEVKVSVLEGIVQLFESEQPNKTTTLTAGETGFYLKKKKAIKKMARVAPNEISWKTQKIIFENTSLTEVAEVLSSTFHVTFEVTPAVAECTITVQFDQKDLASVLSVLKSTLNLKISKQGNSIIIDGEGCEKR